jgi:hypothetical protein
MEAIANLAGVDLPRGMKSTRQKALDDAVEWIRNNDPIPEEVDEPALIPLTKLSGTPMPKKLMADNKKETLDDVVDFLRNYDLDEKHVDKPTLEAILNLTSSTFHTGKSPLGKRL